MSEKYYFGKETAAQDYPALGRIEQLLYKIEGTPSTFDSANDFIYSGLDIQDPDEEILVELLQGGILDSAAFGAFYPNRAFIVLTRYELGLETGLNEVQLEDVKQKWANEGPEVANAATAEHYFRNTDQYEEAQAAHSKAVELLSGDALEEYKDFQEDIFRSRKERQPESEPSNLVPDSKVVPMPNPEIIDWAHIIAAQKAGTYGRDPIFEITNDMASEVWNQLPSGKYPYEGKYFYINTESHAFPVHICIANEEGQAYTESFYSKEIGLKYLQGNYESLVGLFKEDAEWKKSYMDNHGLASDKPLSLASVSQEAKEASVDFADDSLRPNKTQPSL